MKTLVNIITEDCPIPAYLFIKEKYREGDRIMYISAKDTEDDMAWLSAIDGVSSDFIEEIVLKKDIDEFKYEKICRAIKIHLKKGVKYCVNLAGGTRYMALAVQQVFEEFDAEYYYTNVEDNTIIKSKYDNSIYDDDDIILPIKYRMNLSEYLHCHKLENNLEKREHIPGMSCEMAENMFRLFSNSSFTSREYDMLELLREKYRDKRHTDIAEIEQKLPGINVREFLNKTNIIPVKRRLTEAQVEWLTGGWLEEYMYYKVKEIIAPDDLATGVKIRRKGVRHSNELDVIFIKNNQLFVIECKTGVKTESMFSEIVYKACALKEALLGVSCHSYIASLKQDSMDDLKKIASSMDIRFWDYDVMTRNLNKRMKDINEMTRLYSFS